MLLSAGFTLSICAGLCAALASCVAKLAMSGEEIQSMCQEIIQNDLLLLWDCTKISYVLRAISFLSMFLFNGLMWTLFVKSLQYCQSSVQATITNSSANFFFTALFGRFLFGEMLSMKWWCGASLIILGLLLIHKGSGGEEGTAKHDAKKSR
ncbi:transmembrane protein 42-like [Amphiura filiformis]|uniref:transmembrane protein 42-like n=1 Tax=Amphiura filiformis TaxID=82378 RepID=UPI003B225FB0